MKSKFTKLIQLVATLFPLITFAQLSGTKTIGGASPDYATISDAVAAAKLAGINGDVIFNIRDGVYTETLDINNIAGTNTYSITFQSESLDSSKVKINSTLTTSSQELINLYKIKNITFQFLTLEISSTTSSSIIFMKDGVDNLSILHVTFLGSNRQNMLINSAQPLMDETGCNGLNIQNCTFISGNNGIRLYGGYYGSFLNVTIKNNVFKKQWYVGINIREGRNVTIEGNTITSFESYDGGYYSYAIGLDFGNDYKISKNRIYTSFGSGIWIKSITNTNLLKREISNNIITQKVLPSGMGTTGISTESCSFMDIVHNSIRIIGSGTGYSNDGLYIKTTTNLNIVNNLIHNNEYYAIQLDSKNGVLQCDYNYLNGGNNNFCRYNNTTNSTFSDWKLASTLDANSIVGGITFTSDTSLHAASNILMDKGTAWASVSTDFDGESRSATTPDIGADEFMTTGIISGINLQTEIKCFPNPTTGRLYFDNLNQTDDMTISLVSMDGILVKEYTGIQSNSIDLSEYHGFFLVKIKTTDAIRTLKVFIVE